ncbi:MFS transporter [Nocardia panacis]|uniref:MFS transporter n=1 Tax=Nocardia panacis TaxID=2340916 RepID=A0A3A4KHB0_9NOCA|nr:MFS transporter [Nocardia panacis]RJO72230.1 MFS transporter [Nocardia panacis]
MTSSDSAAGWRGLVTGGRLGAAVVLAGGTALYAISSYVTASLLPTAIRDIGGARYLAWATTVFVVASIASSTLVSRMLAVRGPIVSYLIGYGLFAAGTVVAALSPTMAVMLVGRVIQGLGGGLVMALAYGVIHLAYPQELRRRATALVSAMWGVGTFIGPALGGVFAQLGYWRLAFVALAVLTAGIAAVVPYALRGSAPTGMAQAAPIISLTLLAAAAALVSIASVLHGSWTLLGIVGALGVSAVFIGYERRASATVLPKATYHADSPLRWIYLTMIAVAIGISVENFVPLFAQGIGGLGPLLAGFIGAAASLAWTVAQVWSVNATPAGAARLRVIGPAVIAAGLVLAAIFQITDGDVGRIVVWTLCLMVAGTGIGLSWPHLATAVMGATTDPLQGQQASAAIGTVQLIANAFGAAISGVLVNLGEPSMVRSVRYLEIGLAVIAVLGVAGALAARGRVRSEPVRTAV